MTLGVESHWGRFGEETGGVSLQLLHLSQSSHSGPDGSGGSGGVVPGSSGNPLDPALLVAALPDADSLPLHALLATEGAHVLGVLADLHLLHGLTEGGTIPGSVLAGDTDLLGTLGHFRSFSFEVNQAI